MTSKRFASAWMDTVGPSTTSSSNGSGEVSSMKKFIFMTKRACRHSMWALHDTFRSTTWASLWNSDEGALLAGAEDPDKVYLEEIRPGKLQLQMEYVQKRSLWIDFKIIVQAISSILGFPLENMASNPKKRTSP